ncbi:MAG: sigma-70 family RNA polymerase sigma factor [Candidatus Eremiobacteraeota bacterium]|nr:sigma-70 family RNA polymerase sigma factor [Candidatus Eremiobacteraeota bacterium]
MACAPHAKDTDRVAAFERERLHLLAIAFRVLGAQSEAEDVVQETWIKFQSSDTSGVRNVPAWLTTVATRCCLDTLRRRREIPYEAASLPADDAADIPQEAALLSEELTAAFVVVLTELTPPQRVAIVLHDAFGVPFEEIAHILGTSTESAKKLASRARARVRGRPFAPIADVAKARHVVQAFLRAAQEGDTEGLVAVLDPAVVRTADPQVLRRGAPQRIQGVQAVVAEARAYRANARRARLAFIDGRPGIVVRDGAEIRSVLLVRVVGELVVHFDVVADPARLAHLAVRIAQDA